jgi:uncharacterized membrane protein
MATEHAMQEDFEVPGAVADAALEALPRRRSNGGDGRLATGLGWFSMGLGMAEVAAPGLLARLIGMPDDDDNCELLRAAGLREIASGIGILTRDRRAGWVWARVGGDVMDLALLGSAFRSDQSEPRRLMAATAAVAGVTALDVVCGRQLSRESQAESLARVTKAITVNRSPAEVYAYWHDFENLPRFMRHLESVRAAGPRRSHWVAKGPAGATVEWDAEIVEDRQNELIGWRSLKGADVDNRGSVAFRPAPRGQGTEVTVQMQYDPPAGGVGEALAMLFGEQPEQQLQEDLRRFKQVIETGEIARSRASESFGGMWKAAQPGAVPSYDEFEKGER